MEVVLITGAISCAKLQSKCCHQQTNTQFFTGRMAFNSKNCISKLITHWLTFNNKPDIMMNGHINNWFRELTQIQKTMTMMQTHTHKKTTSFTTCIMKPDLYWQNMHNNWPWTGQECRVAVLEATLASLAYLQTAVQVQYMDYHDTAPTPMYSSTPDRS